MAVAQSPPPPRAGLFKRMLLGAGVVVAAMNIWTGAPLLALWIGSRLQPDTQPTMSSIFVVAFLLAVFCGVLVWMLGRLSLAYDQARGAKPPPRQQAPWMRSMRGERAKDLKRERPASPTEKIMIGVVVLAVLSFEFWFFFLASSPLPNQ